MPDKHAVCSASSAGRWFMCPPSAWLNAALPDIVSEAAKEGTKAHALAEKVLKAFLAGGDGIVKNDADHPAEMVEAVQKYVDICIEKINAARKASPDAQVYVERMLDYSTWVPDGFGTGDCVMVSDDTLEVIDFKYGKGVRVEAEGNPQMRLYALGMLDAFGLLYDADIIRMTIVQPRIDNIATSEMHRADLLAWIASKKQVIAEAAAGTGKRAAGPHCRFCKVKATCRTLAEYELQNVKEDLKASELTDAEIADIVERAASIKRWLTAIEEYALQEALDGKTIPGLKVVAGRSVRKISDADRAAQLLKDAGYSDIYKPMELKTLTALEKEIGKKKLAGVLADVIQKPEGKPTLVPESDRRPALALQTLDKNKDFDDSLISKKE